MINLLPIEQKNELKREEKWKLGLILGIVFSIFLLCLFLILLSIRIDISSEVQIQKDISSVQEKQFKTPELEEFQGEITLLNSNLLGLKAFYQEQSSPSKVLEKISAAIPPAIYLTHLSWQEETSRVEMSGYAPFREDLFALKNNLEKESGFKDIYFPPSDWIKSKTIDFYVTFTASSEE